MPGPALVAHGIMLPKIKINAGRGLAPHGGGSGGSAEGVVPLQRLRLLKPASCDGRLDFAVPQQNDLLPDLGQAPRWRSRGLLRPLGAGNAAEPSDSASEPPPGVRGLLRPLGSDRPVAPAPRRVPQNRGPGRPPLPRALSPLQAARGDATADPVATEQQLARERLREHARQKRKLAKEEEQRREREEQERRERLESAAQQVEAHRRELARRAAEVARREREERESALQERESIASERRKRTQKYARPERIRESLREVPHSADVQSTGEESVVATPTELGKEKGCRQLAPSGAARRSSRGRRRHQSPGGSQLRGGSGASRPKRTEVHVPYYRQYVLCDVGSACWAVLHAAFETSVCPTATATAAGRAPGKECMLPDDQALGLALISYEKVHGHAAADISCAHPSTTEALNDPTSDVQVVNAVHAEEPADGVQAKAALDAGEPADRGQAADAQDNQDSTEDADSTKVANAGHQPAGLVDGGRSSDDAQPESFVDRLSEANNAEAALSTTGPLIGVPPMDKVCGDPADGLQASRAPNIEDSANHAEDNVVDHPDPAENAQPSFAADGYPVVGLQRTAVAEGVHTEGAGAQHPTFQNESDLAELEESPRVSAAPQQAKAESFSPSFADQSLCEEAACNSALVADDCAAHLASGAPVEEEPNMNLQVAAADAEPLLPVVAAKTPDGTAFVELADAAAVPESSLESPS